MVAFEALNDASNGLSFEALNNASNSISFEALKFASNGSFRGIIKKCLKKLLTTRVNAALFFVPQKTF